MWPRDLSKQTRQHLRDIGHVIQDLPEGKGYFPLLRDFVVTGIGNSLS